MGFWDFLRRRKKSSREILNDLDLAMLDEAYRLDRKRKQKYVR